jgi:hypothetical protein
MSNSEYNDIRHYHEVLAREERPTQGKQFLVSKDDVPAYTAVVTDYKGGCWASVRVMASANEKYNHLYKEGMEFEIKVAHYSFQEIPWDAQPDSTI